VREDEIIARAVLESYQGRHRELEIDPSQSAEYAMALREIPEFLASMAPELVEGMKEVLFSAPGILVLARGTDERNLEFEKLREFGPWLIEEAKKLETIPSFSFVDKNRGMIALLMLPKDSLQALKEVDYPASCLFGVIARVAEVDPSPETINSIVDFLPRSLEAISNRYKLEYLSSYIDEDPQQQLPFLIASARTLDKLANGQSAKLLAIMSFINSVKEPNISSIIQEKISNGEISSIDALYPEAIEIIVEALSAKYPEELLRALQPESLEQFVRVFTTYEKTLIHFGKIERVPVMRVLAVVEMLGREDDLRTNAPEFIEHLLGNLDQYFPQKSETESIRSYLRARAETKELEQVFPMNETLESNPQEFLAAWNDPSCQHTHILSEVSLEDKLAYVRNMLDAVFLRGHLSAALMEIEKLTPGTNAAKELGDLWKRIDRLESSIRKDGVETVRTANKEDVDEILPAAFIESDDVKILDYLGSRKREVEQGQSALREWAPLRRVSANYEQKLSSLYEEFAELREALTPFQEIIENLGFDYKDSFGDRVFRGELTLLREAVEVELEKIAGSLDDVTKDKIKKLSEVLSKLDGISIRSMDYMQTLGEQLKKSWDLLEQKRKEVVILLDKLNNNAGLDNAMQAISAFDSRLASLVERETASLTDTHERIGKINEIINLYLDLTALSDIRSIIGAINEAANGEQRALVYRGEHCFSALLEAMTGQCLDYRSSKNSIGNSVYNISLQDSIREVVVGRDESGSPRVNAITYLSNVSIGNSESELAIVLDTPYVPDGSTLSSSKVEGLMEFLILKAARLGVPVVIPQSTSVNLHGKFDEYRERGIQVQEGNVVVGILPGPTGSTYCEISSYVHYDAEKKESCNAIVLRPLTKST